MLRLLYFWASVLLVFCSSMIKIPEFSLKSFSGVAKQQRESRHWDAFADRAQGRVNSPAQIEATTSSSLVNLACASCYPCYRRVSLAAFSFVCQHF